MDVEDNRDGTYKVYFRVDKPGEYVLNIKFGGETIPDGLYTFTVSSGLELHNRGSWSNIRAKGVT